MMFHVLAETSTHQLSAHHHRLQYQLLSESNVANEKYETAEIKGRSHYLFNNFASNVFIRAMEWQGSDCQCRAAGLLGSHVSSCTYYDVVSNFCGDSLWSMWCIKGAWYQSMIRMMSCHPIVITPFLFIWTANDGMILHFLSQSTWSHWTRLCKEALYMDLQHRSLSLVHF